MNKNSLRTWGLVLALVLFSGIASVGFPWINGLLRGGSQVSVPAETHSIVIALPAALAEALPEALVTDSSLVIHPAAALAVLAVVVGGAVVITGGGLALLYTLLDRRVAAAKDDEAFQSSLAAVEKRAGEQIKAQQTDRPTKPKPDHMMPRWSIASTTLIFLIFAFFAGTALSDTFYPDRQMMLFGADVGARSVFVLSSMLLTAVVIGLIYRPRLLAISRDGEDAAAAGIPWDTIYVVFTGMIFIAIGVGMVLWLSSAPLG